LSLFPKSDANPLIFQGQDLKRIQSDDEEHDPNIKAPKEEVERKYFPER